MKVWDIPWFERPGARLKKVGAEGLSDAELLASEDCIIGFVKKIIDKCIVLVLETRL
jgi:DNA repair protein RadC